MMNWACRPVHTGGSCRLLQALRGGRGGQLSQLFVGASPAVVDAIRCPHPEVLQVLHPRPLLDEARHLGRPHRGWTC